MGKTVKAYQRSDGTMVKPYVRRDKPSKSSQLVTYNKQDVKKISIDDAYANAPKTSDADMLDNIFNQHNSDDSLNFILVRNPALGIETLQKMAEMAAKQNDYELGSLIVKHNKANEEIKKIAPS